MWRGEVKNSSMGVGTKAMPHNKPVFGCHKRSSMNTLSKNFLFTRGLISTLLSSSYYLTISIIVYSKILLNQKKYIYL